MLTIFLKNEKINECKNQRSRKRVQPPKKRKKSCFLDFEKTLKSVKKRTYSFTGHLIT